MKIVLDKNEILRYLGSRNQNIDPKWHEKIDLKVSEILKDAAPVYVYKEFAIISNDGGIMIEDENTSLTGRSLAKHLAGCTRCALLAATLGVGVDNKLRLLQKISMTDAIIYDACANAYIEQVCDNAEKEIGRIAAGKGFYLTSRFSPGYGDFGLENQTALLSLTGAMRLAGITLSASNLLLPQKSVTAVIGYTKENRSCNNRCYDCENHTDCLFRR